MKGILFDSKHYAVHDGPGIRLTLFFKGCPLQCWWCHNPESQQLQPQTYKKKETLDGQTFFRDTQIGYHTTVEELIQLAEQDRPFFEESQGGVTLSGGEPLMQAQFAANLLEALHQSDIHTAVDTCGHAPWESFEKILPHTDLVLYDLKLVDANKHKKYTGVDNALILNNFQTLCKHKQPMHVRIPLIPDITDTNENIDGLMHLLKGQEAVKRIDLLPYHAISISKYQRFGMPFRMDEALRLDQEKATAIYTQLQQAGLPAVYEG